MITGHFPCIEQKEHSHCYIIWPCFVSSSKLRTADGFRTSLKSALVNSRGLENADFGKRFIWIYMIHRIIHILIYHFVDDRSTCFPLVCTSAAKAPF